MNQIFRYIIPAWLVSQLIASSVMHFLASLHVFAACNIFYNMHGYYNENNLIFAFTQLEAVELTNYIFGCP